MSLTNVSAVQSSMAAYTEYGTASKKTSAEETVKEAEQGAVYEASKETEKKATYSINKMSAADRKALVSQLKADSEARESQFVSMIQKMISGQTNAYGKANDIWQFIASGNYTVDAQTKMQAQADIAEDGYYGVKQTSERIFDFACALAGDDVEKMKEMQKAFEKGFAQAEKTWGGTLPDISYKTKEAVSKKFEEYYAAQGTV